MTPRNRLGSPGLTVHELRGSLAGSQDMQEGRAAVFVKSAEMAEHPVVLHEFLATRLAHSMGLPVPFGEVAALSQGRGWASAVLGGTGQAAPPADVPLAAKSEPHIFEGICVFDLWIHNIDRNDENTYFSHEYGLWALDHEKAFAGHNPRLPGADLMAERNRVERPFQRIEVTPRGDSFVSWEALVRRFGSSWATTACDIARRRGLQDKAGLDTYRAFLEHRARNIETLVKQAFPERWGTLLDVSGE